MSTTTFEFGDIVLVPFPYTNQLASKRRPAVVISSPWLHRTQRDIILVPVTSRVRAMRLPGEVIVSDWMTAGLLKPSVLKPVIMTLEQTLVVRRIGRLAESDRAELADMLAVILAT